MTEKKTRTVSRPVAGRRPRAKSAATGSRRAAAGVPKTARPRKAPARQSITFQFHAPEARDVSVAGTFSGWTLRPMKRRKNGSWALTLRPETGVHEYKFLVDHTWLEDPDNPRKTPDNHGGYNSVCIVGDIET